MDTVTEHLPSRPVTRTEAVRLADLDDLDHVRPFVTLSNGSEESVVVVYVETDRAGDYVGYDPEAGAWEHVAVADVSDDPIVHARSAAHLFAWLDAAYPNGGYTIS